MRKNVEEFVNYFEKIRGRTLRAADAIPRDKFDWAPVAGKFSFADILRHLASIERYMYAENIQLRPSRYPGHGRELADGPDAVLDFVSRLHAESVEIFRSLNDEDLASLCETPGGAKLSVSKWLRAMVEHEVHHRGQIYLMLGILGVPSPALYGLTSEEVKARSLPNEGRPRP
jgi:uncharacterized damage-inducible protein DinB